MEQEISEFDESGRSVVGHPLPDDSEESIQLDYSMGGVTFRCIIPRDSYGLEELQHYSLFVDVEVKERPDFVLRVQGKGVEMPELPVGVEKFNGGAWSLFKVGQRCLAMDGHALMPPKVFWRALLGEESENAAVWCNYKLAEDKGLGAEIFTEPVFRVLMKSLLINRLAEEQRGLLIHSSAVVMDGKAYLFAGHSGAGKSTTAALFEDDERAELINDDRVLLLQKGQGWVVQGTPWCGDLQVARNISAPLGGIFLIEKAKPGDSVFFEPLDPRGAARRLMSVVTIPWYLDTLADHALGVLGELSCSNTPFFRFTLSPSRESAEAFIAFAKKIG